MFEWFISFRYLRAKHRHGFISLITLISVAGITVGDNIGARLQADQAEADTRVAKAQAEGRRAMAVAREQEARRPHLSSSVTSLPVVPAIHG